MHERHPLSEQWFKWDLSGLIDDMRKHGFRNEPIAMYEGKVLDGWNRLQAATEAGVEPKFETFVGTLDEAKAFVISKNKLRRHGSKAQIAQCAVQTVLWGGGTMTDAELASLAGVSVRSIELAKQIERNGLGVEVREGTLTARGALDQIKPATVAGSEPEPEPEPPAAPDLASDNAELHAELAKAVEEIETLTKLVTGDQAEVLAENRALRSQLAVVEAQRNDWMNQCAEMKKEIAYLRRRTGVAA